MLVDVFLADEQAVSGQTFAQPLTGRQWIGAEHRPVVTAGREVLKVDELATRRADARLGLGAQNLHSPLAPPIQIIASDDVVIDPVHSPRTLIVEHAVA